MNFYRTSFHSCIISLNNFSSFAMKLGQLIKHKIVFVCYNFSSLIAKIGKQVKQSLLGLTSDLVFVFENHKTLLNLFD